MPNFAGVARPPVPYSVQAAIAAQQRAQQFAFPPQLSQQGIAHILQQQQMQRLQQQQPPTPQPMTPEATQFLLARQQAGLLTPQAQAQQAPASTAKVPALSFFVASSVSSGAKS